jgi:hypothetical protein
VYALGSFRVVWYLGVVCVFLGFRGRLVCDCITIWCEAVGYVRAFAFVVMCVVWLAVWARWRALGVLKVLGCFGNGG